MHGSEVCDGPQLGKVGKRDGVYLPHVSRWRPVVQPAASSARRPRQPCHFFLSFSGRRPLGLLSLSRPACQRSEHLGSVGTGSESYRPGQSDQTTKRENGEQIAETMALHRPEASSPASRRPTEERTSQAALPAELNVTPRTTARATTGGALQPNPNRLLCASQHGPTTIRDAW